MKTELVIFDLDGTLIDSSGDIAWAANRTLGELGFGQRSVEDIRARIGRGVSSLLERLLTEAPGLPAAAVKETTWRASDVFLGFYATRLLVETAPYPGVTEALGRIIESGRKAAVVTNKPEGLTKKVLDGLSMSGYFRMVVGGDTFETSKPHPKPLLAVLEAIGVAPEKALFVGDSEVDCEAGARAGLEVVGAGWGFRGRVELERCGCSVVIDDISELMDMLA